MVLLFGFGPGEAKDLGEVAPVTCPNCHNNVFLHHLQSKKAVRLYFVPVVPYGTDEYLLCPICNRGLQLKDGQQAAVGAMQGGDGRVPRRAGDARRLPGPDHELLAPARSCPHGRAGAPGAGGERDAGHRGRGRAGREAGVTGPSPPGR